jgi:DNA-binding response OmpR family regulator
MKPVYVIEPHADTAELEKAFLEENGFEVQLMDHLDAGDGALQSPNIGLVLLTVGPKDGSIADLIVSKAAERSLPLVVVTTVHRARERWPSASAVLEKPFDFDEFHRIVRAFYRS